ncbi:NADH dehydrogenase [Friedmanniella luteola]|uniref:NADH:ubiquinone reductase (non-electrogenic) n=1 Tax=Friedmanniella luteola TaxID=546871 RepID=A0A1H1ZRU9_9ACTN|nr:NAD(P)/FAD-dependent oxidoreductase [Friedmanniella luteola]SDT36307.1 NADH dehydrogenase [Friedmanniella luteola]
MPHVVVVGAGFAGLSATAELAKEGFRVTLINRHPYNTFQPLLYQVATGGLNAGDVTYSLRYFAARHAGVRFRRAAVTGIDHDANEVLCDDGVRVGYDYLCVATGITTNHFGIPGAAEYTMSMYTRADALKVRDTIFGSMEIIAGMSSPNTGAFTIVVVGGGATGVEMAGQLAELKTEALPMTYPELNPARVHVVLVEMGDALLAPFDDTLRQYAHKELVKRGVDVRLKTAITEVHPDHVDFKDGTTLPVDLVIWAAGVSGSPVLRDWGLPIGRGGRIEVNSDLRVIGHENVFALGDVSLTVDNPLPQLAQPAIQTGKFAADQIARLHRGLETEDFKYHNKGTMATIGRGDAVLQIPQGLKLKGVVAWLGWIFLHIVYLLGNRNRAQTLLNLFSRYLLPSRSSAIVGDVMETPKLKAIRK